jgi:membrane protease YdiL (CAAX protease family)
METKQFTIADLWDEMRGFGTKNFELIAVVLTSAICLICLHYYVVEGPFRFHLMGLFNNGGMPNDLAALVGWAVGCVMCYFVIPALVLRLMGKNLHDYGWTMRGLKTHSPLYLLLFIPAGIAVVAVSSQSEFTRVYPFYSHPKGWLELAIWEVFYALQFMTLEFFFRGFIVHGLKESLGKVSAVIVMLFPYMMIHFPKPWMETSGAFIAGTLLGWLSLRTGSIFGGVMLHIMVAWSLDILALWHKGWFF